MRQLFYLPVFTDDAKNNTARMLAWMLWSFFLASLLPLALIFILPGQMVRWLLLVGGLDFVSLGLLVVIRRGYIRQATIILVCSLFIMATLLAATAGGMQAPAIPAYIIIVLVAGLLLGVKTGLWVAGIASLTELGLVLAGQYGYLSTSNWVHTDYSVWVVNTSLLMVTAALQMLATRTIQNALKQAHQELAQRNKAVAELSKSEDHFRSLIENTSDIFIEFAPDGKFLYISPSIERVMGYSPEELSSHLCLEKIHPNDQAKVRRVFGEVLENPGRLAEIIIARVQHCNGSWRYIEGSGKAQVDDCGRKHLFINARDITERKQHENELELVATVSAALRKAVNRNQMIPVILEQLVALFNVDGGSIVMIEKASGNAVIELALGAWSNTTGLVIPAGRGLEAAILATGKPYISQDAMHDPDRYWPDSLSICQSMVGVPLIAQDQTIGFLWAGRQANITENEIHLLTAIANITASAIYRSTLFEQTEKRLEQISALRRIEQTISGSLNLRITLGVLIEQARLQLGADAASILLLNPHLHVLEYAAGQGFIGKDIERSRVRLGEDFAGRAALEQSVVYIRDLKEKTRDLVFAKLLSGEGFVSYHAIPLISKGQVKGVLEIFHRRTFYPDPEWLDFLATLGGQAAIAIDNSEMFQNLQRTNAELALAYDTTIESWSQAVDQHVGEDIHHIQVVLASALELARNMDIPEDDLVHFRRGVLLHDIGSIILPESIYKNKEPLTSNEWDLIHQHPVRAYEMLYPINYLRRAIDIPYCHHEKWDGSGYPRGLKGEQIPIAARIFAVVDVYHALISARPYREAWRKLAAVEFLRGNAGTQFDPQVVGSFLRLIND